MNIKNTIIFLLIFASFSVDAEESIYNRAENVVAKLEVLNNLGRSCDYYLSIKGMEGAQTEECTKFLNNIQGPFFKGITDECVSLSDWYEEKRKFIASNSDLAKRNPEEAKNLVRDMKAVNRSCHPDSLRNYEYLTKPLKKINALSELK